MKNRDLIASIASTLTLVAAILFPFWFLPVTVNAFGFQKQYLLVAFAAVMLLLWIAQSLKNKRVLLSFSTINILPVAAAVVTGISAFIIPNSLYQLSGRFVTVTALAVALLFGASVARRVTWNQLLKVWLYTASLMSVLTLLQLTPFSPASLINQVLGTSFPTSLIFNLTESPLVFLTFAIPVGLAGLVATLKQMNKKSDSLALNLLKGPLPWSVVTLATSAVTGVAIITDKNLRPVLLPFQYGWSIAVESFKQLPTFLVGFGPENFTSAFHRFREVSYNTTDLWDVRFGTSSSEILHSLTTTGVLGMGAILLFLLALLMAAKQLAKGNPSLLVFVFSQVVLFFLLPFSALTWGVLALTGLVVMSELRREKATSIKDVVVMLSAIQIVPEGSMKAVRTNAGFAYVVSALVALLGAIGLYMAGRVYASNVMYYLALRSANNNDAVKTYEQQQWAIRLNPADPLYRRSYANTNLAIAQALSQKGEELTDEERQTMSELLQQSIREARNSATLNPAQTENWETVATVYSQLLDVEGADQWANAALVQAIQTDPVAPGLRLSLAGLYRQLKQPVQAQRLIEQAIELKPDWANAYYNYGDILEAQEQSILAYQAYQQTLQLLPAESEDRKAVQTKLDELKPKAEAALAELQKQQAAQQAQGQQGQNGKQIPTPEKPTVPNEQPKVENPPAGFEEIVNNQPASPTPQAEASPTPSGENIVLPEDVGF
jgi:tetratricopeptide (TPR) repeat protein